MIKKTSSISINVLSAFVILLCLLLGVVNPVNAWFTDSHKNGVKIVVDIGDLKLKVYQNSKATANEIFTNEDNVANETNQYVTLSGEIKPDTAVGLTLILSNEDQGSASMYVRYKFELYRRTQTTDVLLTTNLAGFTAQSTTQKGFKLNTTDGYYYYKDTTGANALFEKNATATMMTSFTVPYSAFVDQNGTMLAADCDTVYIKLIIDASVANFA